MELLKSSWRMGSWREFEDHGLICSLSYYFLVHDVSCLFHHLFLPRCVALTKKKRPKARGLSDFGLEPPVLWAKIKLFYLQINGFMYFITVEVTNAIPTLGRVIFMKNCHASHITVNCLMEYSCSWKTVYNYPILDFLLISDIPKLYSELSYAELSKYMIIIVTWEI